MAKCEICGKGVTFGIKVSHSHRRTNRTWKSLMLEYSKKSTSFASLFFMLFKIQQKNGAECHTLLRFLLCSVSAKCSLILRWCKNRIST